VNRRNLLLVVLLAMVAVLAACGGEDDAAPTTTEDDGALSGYTREPTPSVADVELPIAAGGEVLPATADDGGLRIVYFGYTSCPDVCPTTMSDVKQALAELPEEDRDRIDVAMVTVDPDRDVPEKLGAYVTTFVPEGAAVRFDDDEGLASAAAAFGAQYEVETNDEGEIEVGHSADLYVVDDRGDVVLQWPFGTSSEDIAADLRSLLA
jgi:protein SCO1/2